jgi:hypothetical protein
VVVLPFAGDDAKHGESDDEEIEFHFVLFGVCVIMHVCCGKECS